MPIFDFSWGDSNPTVQVGPRPSSKPSFFQDPSQGYSFNFDSVLGTILKNAGKVVSPIPYTAAKLAAKDGQRAVDKQSAVERAKSGTVVDSALKDIFGRPVVPPDGIRNPNFGGMSPGPQGGMPELDMPTLPPPLPPELLDPVQARVQADEYLRTQLAAIAQAQTNTQNLYNTNSRTIGSMYEGLSDAIRGDQGLINSSYNTAQQTVDKNYSEARESIGETEAQSLARREALARRLGTQQGTNELAKDVTDQTADLTALLANNETAMSDFLTSRQATDTSYNTANAQNAIRAGNAAKTELTNQLQQILGQLDLKRTDAASQAEQMYAGLFNQMNNQNYERNQRYQDQVYNRQRDEYAMTQDLMNRQWDQQKFFTQLAGQNQPEAADPIPYQAALNALAPAIGQNKAQRGIQLAYDALGSDAVSAMANPGQLAAVIRQMPGSQGFSDQEIAMIASALFQNEKSASRSSDLTDMLNRLMVR